MTIPEIQQRIYDRFLYYTGEQIAEDTAMDFYSLAISDVLKEVYGEIEASRMPHLYTKLAKEGLDDLGFLLNMPRNTEEKDASYLYRLMNWKLQAETGNERAIETKLMNLTYASYAKFIPLSNGCGTGAVYIIPKTYDNDTAIANAMEEAKERLKDVSSGGIYIEYIVPEPQAIVLNVGVRFSQGTDSIYLKQKIEDEIRYYTNDIAPNDYLQIGNIEKIGINIEGIQYFSVFQLFIDEQEIDGTEILQRLTDKYLLDEIVWTDL